ncbi:MAG: hypothetical protein AB1689_12140 [Thermodesulfobacteriota bacterium]
MLRLGIGLGLGLLLASFLFRSDLPPAVRPDRNVEPNRVASDAVVVELEDQVGIPPSAATEIPARDSAAARRQAVARTLRDLTKHPPTVEPRDPNPEAAAQFTAELSAALQRGGDP